MKRCTKCGVEKDESDFYKRGGRRPGLRAICKVCTNSDATAWQRANPEKVAARDARYAKKNPEAKKKTYKNWASRNRPRLNSGQSLRRELRRGRELNVAERVECEAMYEYHQIFNAVMLGKEWHVDHIEAIANGGMHNPSNLQVLTREDNQIKGARV